MKELSDEQIEKIISLLKKGVPFPEDDRLSLLKYLEQSKNSLLFDTKKEYELIYADKEREEDILADTMAVPLQKIKTFRNSKGTVPDLLALRPSETARGLSQIYWPKAVESGLSPNNGRICSSLAITFRF